MDLNTLKNIGKRGALFVEYAVVLALVLVASSLFIGNAGNGIGKNIMSIFNQVDALFGNQTIDIEDINRRNLALVTYIAKNNPDKGSNRPGYKLTDDTGPYDSEYGQGNVKKISDANLDNINGGSWVLVNYIDKTTGDQLCDVCIYNLEKNNNIALKDYTEDTNIITDLYRINYTSGGAIEHIENPVVKTKVAVGKKKDGSETNRYNVIRNAEGYVKNPSRY